MAVLLSKAVQRFKVQNRTTVVFVQRDCVAVFNSALGIFNSGLGSYLERFFSSERGYLVDTRFLFGVSVRTRANVLLEYYQQEAPHTGYVFFGRQGGNLFEFSFRSEGQEKGRRYGTKGLAIWAIGE
jgi:hypothetical protein